MAPRNRISMGSMLSLLVAGAVASCAASQRPMPRSGREVSVAAVGTARDERAQVAGPVRAVCGYRRAVPSVPGAARAAPNTPSAPAAAVDHAPSSAERPLADRVGPLPLSHSQPRTTCCGSGLGAVLRARVAAETDALRACYDARPRGGPAVEPRMVIRVTWANDGNVEGAEVLDALFDEDGAVSRCVAGLVACWHILPLGCERESRVTVNYPLRFADGS